MYCPKSAPANSTMMTSPMPPMNALTNNPNGRRWLAKYNRMVARTSHKTRHP
jgi:hypothetical protein